MDVNILCAVNYLNLSKQHFELNWFLAKIVQLTGLSVVVIHEFKSFVCVNRYEMVIGILFIGSGVFNEFQM